MLCVVCLTESIKPGRYVSDGYVGREGIHQHFPDSCRWHFVIVVVIYTIYNYLFYSYYFLMFEKDCGKLL